MCLRGVCGLKKDASFNSAKIKEITNHKTLGKREEMFEVKTKAESIRFAQNKPIPGHVTDCFNLSDQANKKADIAIKIKHIEIKASEVGELKSPSATNAEKQNDKMITDIKEISSKGEFIFFLRKVSMVEAVNGKQSNHSLLESLNPKKNNTSTWQAKEISIKVVKKRDSPKLIENPFWLSSVFLWTLYNVMESITKLKKILRQYEKAKDLSSVTYRPTKTKNRT